MKEEDKKKLEGIFKKGEPLKDLMDSAGKDETEVMKDMLFLQQQKLSHNMLVGIAFALLDKGIITSKDLDKGLVKATKKAEEQINFFKKLDGGD